MIFQFPRDGDEPLNVLEHGFSPAGVITSSNMRVEPHDDVYVGQRIKRAHLANTIYPAMNELFEVMSVRSGGQLKRQLRIGEYACRPLKSERMPLSKDIGEPGIGDNVREIWTYAFA